MDARRLVPPFLIDFFVRINRRRHGFLGNYGSWLEAEKACFGYQSETVVSSYVDKYFSEVKSTSSSNARLVFSDREIRIMNALQFSLGSRNLENVPLKILDFGGAYGNHVPLFRKLFGEKAHEYVICESPAVSKAFNEIDTDGIVWTSNLDGFEGRVFDVVFSSCTLPYVENPFESLAKLSELSAWLVLDRTPVFTEEHSKIFKQNSFTPDKKKVSYPAWYFAESDLFKWFEVLGLTIELSWDVPEDRPYVNGTRLPYRGYLLRKSSDPRI